MKEANLYFNFNLNNLSFHDNVIAHWLECLDKQGKYPKSWTSRDHVSYAMKYLFYIEVYPHRHSIEKIKEYFKKYTNCEIDELDLDEEMTIEYIMENPSSKNRHPAAYILTTPSDHQVINTTGIIPSKTFSYVYPPTGETLFKFHEPHCVAMAKELVSKLLPNEQDNLELIEEMERHLTMMFSEKLRLTPSKGPNINFSLRDFALHFIRHASLLKRAKTLSLLEQKVLELGKQVVTLHDKLAEQDMRDKSVA